MTECPAPLSRRLDRELADGMPAGDPPTLTDPAGDARDLQGCCCGSAEGQRADVAERPTKAASNCCGA
jgi:hypothetical protein